jgi:hypothetical protein
MSHTTINFLTIAESLTEAESRVNDYLESEHFFDYFTILPESSGQLDQKLHQIIEFCKGFDWLKTAGGFLEQAEKCKTSGIPRQYGCYLIKAGELLYAGNLTIDTYVYNMDSGNYSIPDELKGYCC